MSQQHSNKLEIKPVQLDSALYQVKPTFDEQACQARLEWLRSINGNWFMAMNSSIPVGWVIITWPGKPSHPNYPDLSDLYVVEAWRNRRIGTTLINYMELLARQRQYKKIGLAVNPDLNLQAHALYLRLGYKHDGRAKYLDGIYDGFEDWVIDLEKDLQETSQTLYSSERVPPNICCT